MVAPIRIVSLVVGSLLLLAILASLALRLSDDRFRASLERTVRANAAELEVSNYRGILEALWKGQRLLSVTIQRAGASEFKWLVAKPQWNEYERCVELEAANQIQSVQACRVAFDLADFMIGLIFILGILVLSFLGIRFLVRVSPTPFLNPDLLAFADLGREAQGVSHDLKSPMTALKISLQHLQTGAPAIAGLVGGAIERIEAIGTSINSQSKELKIEELNASEISEAVEFLIRQYSQLHPEIVFELNVNFGNNVDQHYRCGRELILRALGNLLDNAIEAKASKVVVAVEQSHRYVPKPIKTMLEACGVSYGIRVLVSNNGGKIPTAILKRLAVSQVSSKGSRPGAPRGLGIMLLASRLNTIGARITYQNLRDGVQAQIIFRKTYMREINS